MFQIGVHIVKSIFILHNFVLQQVKYDLTKFVEKEKKGPGDKNCGQSQYRFSERAKRVRDRFL
jgi:hypothetical protein